MFALASFHQVEEVRFVVRTMNMIADVTGFELGHHSHHLEVLGHDRPVEGVSAETRRIVTAVDEEQRN